MIDITKCTLTLILNKIVTVLQCMKNGTLCDVYCEVPWISLCHNIGHACHMWVSSYLKWLDIGTCNELNTNKPFPGSCELRPRQPSQMDHWQICKPRSLLLFPEERIEKENWQVAKQLKLKRKNEKQSNEQRVGTAICHCNIEGYIKPATNF